MVCPTGWFEHLKSQTCPRKAAKGATKPVYSFVSYAVHNLGDYTGPLPSEKKAVATFSTNFLSERNTVL